MESIESVKKQVEEDIAKLKEEIDAKIIRQEHRAIPMYFNLLRYWQKDRSDVKRKAAISAFIVNALSPTSGTVLGIPFLTIIGIVVAVIGNKILQKQTDIMQAQNELITVQNKRVEQQTFLAESNRRAALVFEVSNILDKIYEELDSSVTYYRGENGVMLDVPIQITKLSDKLEARVIAVSRSLKPYRYLDERGELTDKPLSPERAQLFISLASSNILLDKVAEAGDFSYSDLKYASLETVKVIAARMDYSDFENGQFAGSDWDGSSFQYANFRRASLNQTKFNNVVLSHADLRNMHAFQSGFESIIAERAQFDSSRIYASSFFRANLPESSFRYCEIGTCGFREAVLYKANFGMTLLPPADSFKLAYVGEIQLENALVTDDKWLDEFAVKVSQEPKFDKAKWTQVEINPDTMLLFRVPRFRDVLFSQGLSGSSRRKFYLIKRKHGLAGD